MPTPSRYTFDLQQRKFAPSQRKFAPSQRKFAD
jgi:hypothetical protein